MWDLKALIENTKTCAKNFDGEWVPCRPIDCRSIWERLKEAWLVFIGKADCFKWPYNQ